MPDSVARELGRRSAGTSARTAVTALVVLAVGAAVVLGVVDLNPVLVAGVALLLVAIAAVTSAVEIVEAYEKRALTVLGDYRELLEPGLHVVPPFVTRDRKSVV